MSAARPLIEIERVTKIYETRDGPVESLKPITFDIEEGEFIAVVGPSGCGKSTLLKAVGGFILPTEGRISLNGTQVSGAGPDRVFVFQEFDQLLPWKTVKENIVFALTAGGKWTPTLAGERAMHFIAKVNLTEFASSYPHTLSGGMKQRVAIARAMAMEPQILLMDEPFAALDALTRAKMQEELLQLWEDTKFTVLFVTHSIPEAIRVGNRILLMSAHPGQAKAELNSRGTDDPDASGRLLSTRIHELLFDSQIQEGAGAHV